MVSILLAFAIDASWDARSERVRLEAALQNVVSEVSEGREELEGSLRRNRFRMARLERFLSLSPEGAAALHPDSARAIAVSLVPPSPFDPGGVALQSMLGGGSLDLVADSTLANALIAWAQLPDELEEDHRAASALASAVGEAAARHGVATALLNADEAPSIPGAPGLATALHSMRRDPDGTDRTAQLLNEYRDFTGQLADGLTLADEVIALAGR